MAFTVEGEIPVEIAVVSVFLQELSTLDGAVEPFLALFYFVVQRGEHPHFAALQPDEFVRVEDVSFTVKAGEITAVFQVL